MTKQNNSKDDNFNRDDFVYFKSGDTIESSGYKINSILMNQELSPIQMFQNEKKDGIQPSLAKVSDMLNHFAVPTGLLLMQQKAINHYRDYIKDNDLSLDEVISDDLFDKLLKLSSPEPKQKKSTRRRKKIKQKHTKKNKMC